MIPQDTSDSQFTFGRASLMPQEEKLEVGKSKKQLTIGIKCNVVLVAVSAAYKLEVLAVAVCFANPTAWSHDSHRVSSGI